MTISNFNNTYVKVESSFIQEVINDPTGYASIEVGTNINCCTNSDGTEQINTVSVPIDSENTWHINLSNPVGLEANLDAIRITVLNTLLTYNALLAPIDLGYVADTCSGEDCTLETFSAHFAPLIKDAIDDWFAANAITSNVTVTFEDNTVIISDVPNGFLIDGMQSGTMDIPASYNGGVGAFLGGDGLYITPGLFNLTELMDGIYKITIKIIKDDNSYSLETSCAFIDITTKCQVASVLHNLLQESKVAGTEKVSTAVHLLHYALVNGSNCGCNCEELCQVYTELYGLLSNIDPQITNDCGC